VRIEFPIAKWYIPARAQPFPHDISQKTPTQVVRTRSSYTRSNFKVGKIEIIVKQYDRRVEINASLSATQTKRTTQPKNSNVKESE